MVPDAQLVSIRYLYDSAEVGRRQCRTILSFAVIGVEWVLFVDLQRCLKCHIELNDLFGRATVVRIGSDFLITDLDLID